MHRQPSAGDAFVRTDHIVSLRDSADPPSAANPMSDTCRQGIRAVKVGLAGLAVTGALQLAMALISGSAVLLADAIHKLADSVTALPMWIAFLVSRRPPNRRFTYGYGRAEDLAGIVIVALIAASAAVAGYESVRQLLDPRPVRQVGWVLVAGLIGFAGNEFIAYYRLRVGRRIGSAALVADGLHARTDGFISLGVVVGALGVMAGYPIADALVGLAITVAILGVLRSAALSVARRILDAVDPGLVTKAEAQLRDVEGVLAVRRVRLRWVGHTLYGEADLVVDRDLTLVQGHDIADQARQHLRRAIPKLSSVVIEVLPLGQRRDVLSPGPVIRHPTSTG